ncbi:MAG: PmeII family type II restriction endonuclease [Bacteroidales bacterium]|nr:PmeII family type II restriction endonuclease [Bacteroidales bacterium]
MKKSERQQLIENAKRFFKDDIVVSHINNACKSAAKLSSYNVNPFLFKYLANFLRGNDKARSIAEALIYPRLLGSSINTSFGMRIQKMISTMFEGFGSTTKGIDIEFVDQLDERKKYCQLKSGPNTINHDDVETIIGHFKSVVNLARTNNLDIGLQDLVVGVIYGEKSELSSHYQRIDKQYPVIIGIDFWHRLTGQESFYFELIDAMGTVALEVDGRKELEKAINLLELEIKKKYSL